jgi:hypothetical protein
VFFDFSSHSPNCSNYHWQYQHVRCPVTLMHMRCAGGLHVVTLPTSSHSFMLILFTCAQERLLGLTTMGYSCRKTAWFLIFERTEGRSITNIIITTLVYWYTRVWAGFVSLDRASLKLLRQDLYTVFVCRNFISNTYALSTTNILW